MSVSCRALIPFLGGAISRWPARRSATGVRPRFRWQPGASLMSASP